jgi:hypothetical protein
VLLSVVLLNHWQVTVPPSVTVASTVSAVAVSFCVYAAGCGWAVMEGVAALTVMAVHDAVNSLLPVLPVSIVLPGSQPAKS